MISALSVHQIVSAFVVLFAVLNVIGTIPVVLDLRSKGLEINPLKGAFWSFVLLLGFFVAGNIILRLFQVDIASFAVAGAIVIFVIALEMVLGIEISKTMGPVKDATIIPVVFPLIAGAGSFTTLLSLRAEYHAANILIALVLNMMVVFLVLRSTDSIERLIGKGGIYMMRRFFGVILLAIAVRLFTVNIASLISIVKR